VEVECARVEDVHNKKSDRFVVSGSCRITQNGWSSRGTNIDGVKPKKCLIADSQYFVSDVFGGNNLAKSS